MSVSQGWVRGPPKSLRFPRELQSLIGVALKPRERARDLIISPRNSAVGRALRLRNLRAWGLGLTVSPQRVCRLQETKLWAELCPSAKGAIFLYNVVQGSPI